jgi:hypothetical protein
MHEIWHVWKIYSHIAILVLWYVDYSNSYNNNNIKEKNNSYQNNIDY